MQLGSYSSLCGCLCLIEIKSCFLCLIEIKSSSTDAVLLLRFVSGLIKFFYFKVLLSSPSLSMLLTTMAPILCF